MAMKNELGRRAFLLGTATLLSSASLAVMAAEKELLGAGGSTIRPIMTGWLELQKKSLDLNVTYQAIGSPSGTTKILAGITDFAILEIPLSDAQLTTANLYQFPLSFAAIVFVVNIPGVAINQLQLTGQLLGGIYSGAIKKWNDPKIAEANPSLKLPDLDIRVLYHAEPGGAMLGDTIAVTSYLLAANADWRARFPDGINKRWAVGSMVVTGETMTESLKALPGSIGYLPLGAATSAKLSIVAKRDDKGKTVVANQESLRAAVAAIDWAKTPNMVGRLVDLPGEGVWPLVIASYGIVPRDLKNKPVGPALRAFFKFVLTDGIEVSVKRGGEPAPADIRTKVVAQLDKLAN
jgi:phosphate transport system substrate-binding protein